MQEVVLQHSLYHMAFVALDFLQAVDLRISKCVQDRDGHVHTPKKETWIPNDTNAMIGRPFMLKFLANPMFPCFDQPPMAENHCYQVGSIPKLKGSDTMT